MTLLFYFIFFFFQPSKWMIFLLPASFRAGRGATSVMISMLLHPKNWSHSPVTERQLISISIDYFVTTIHGDQGSCSVWSMTEEEKKRSIFNRVQGLIPANTSVKLRSSESLGKIGSFAWKLSQYFTRWIKRIAVAGVSVVRVRI